METKEIYKLFNTDGNNRDGLLKDYLYIPLYRGGDFIKVCKEHNIAILGLEFLKEVGKLIQPFDDANFSDLSMNSWNDYVNNTTDLSLKKIQSTINELKKVGMDTDTIYVDFNIVTEKEFYELEKFRNI